MSARHPESIDRVPLEVELDQHDRLFADDPAVMTRFDRDDLWRLVLDDAAVGVFDVDFAADEEPDMRVHAERGANDWLHVDRPSEPGRVNHALHARLSGPADLEPDIADLAKLRACHRRERRRRCLGPCPGRRTPAGRAPRGSCVPLPYGRLLCRLFLCHVPSRNRRSADASTVTRVMQRSATAPTVNGSGARRYSS